MNHADDTGTEMCPICLNDMHAVDLLHPVQCPACSFNFCVNCLLALLASSKDDYEMASDGSRHVKIHLNCPNCRADISGTIEDTIRVRRTAIAEELQKVPDGELSAKELQCKYWKEENGILIEDEKKSQQNKGAARVRPLEIDTMLFGGLDFAMTEQEQIYVTELMTSGYPDQLCTAAQILSGISELLRKGQSPSIQNATDNTNASNINHNNPPNRVAANTARTTAALQNANAANPMRHGYSNAGVRTNRSVDGERETRVSNYQRQMEQKAREKLRRPLPARMPLCVTLSTGEFEKMALQSRQQAAELEPAADESPRSWLRGWLGKGAEKMRGGATMTFVDDEWDGSVADAFARARIGRGRAEQHVVQARVGPKNPVEQIAVKKILAMGERESREEGQERIPPTRTQRVLVGSVRGQAGKSGIMRGDVVTHVNGEVFTGDAADLNACLVNAYEEQGQGGVVMIVVNAEECTAEALRLRSRVR
mmetsp:Transcript_13830/g.29668  ORF Transcript_13830/g.29668 Transcript_13830/m.29668 type:complete len:482 (+) Transcript_13830:156-1601(+)